MSDFSALHRAGDPLILPNVWDVASARCLVEAGFRALGTTSLGVAAAAGLPDGAGATAAETLRLTRNLAKLPVHLTVDIETGSVGAAVAVAEAGAAGVNMEDAMGPAEAHAALLRSVKRELPQLFVNARTDTYWQRPGDLAETLRRVRRYADAGADGVFVPGLAEPTDIAAVVAAVDVPVNILFLPGQHTIADLSQLGVRRISTGSLLFRAALAACADTALAVRDGLAVRPDLPSYSQINAWSPPGDTVTDERSRTCRALPTPAWGSDLVAGKANSARSLRGCDGRRKGHIVALRRRDAGPGRRSDTAASWLP